LQRLVEPLQERVAACEIILGQGVLGTKTDKAAVNFKAFFVAAFQCQKCAHDPQHVDIIGVPLQNVPEELQFEVDLAFFLIVCGARFRCCRLWPFTLVFPFAGHMPLVLHQSPHGDPPRRRRPWRPNFGALLAFAPKVKITLIWIIPLYQSDANILRKSAGSVKCSERC